MSKVFRWQALAAAGLLLALGAGVRAQEGEPKKGEGEPRDAAPLDRKALDTRVADSLRDVINHGADLYNSGDWAACYRLYEGALMGLKPLLEHRPELQRAIDTGLATARGNPSADRRAFDLRFVIDKIRGDIRGVKAATGPGGAGTLWERLGGENNVKKVIDDFVAAAATDEKVDFFRKGKFPLDDQGVAKFKRLLLEQVSSVSGGPFKYTGRTMKEAHKGMGITDAQFDALAGHLKAALEKNGAKPDDAKAVLEVVGSTRADIVEKKNGGGTDTEPKKDMTLWDRLGGEGNVKKVVDDFVAAAATDEKVDFFRKGKYKLDEEGVAKLKKLLVELVSSVSGGPLKYTGRTMKESHKGMMITDAQFDAAAGHLKNALEKNGAKPDDVKAVMDAVGKTRPDIVEKEGGN
jgi:hemoglobin